MAASFMLLCVQDMLQVLLVVCCVYAGWSAWTLLLDLLVTMDRTKAMRASQKQAALAADHEAPRTGTRDLVDSEATTDDGDEDSSEPEVSCPSPRAPQRQAMALLEQYGVFGASPGAWAQPVL
mmetsp:Transcript_52507/g.151306  ORF Transcript_52507/g.151306 Transcript_52507/m.151306 type:complete len:123 (+) Transcript_52507:158-526(+)